MALCSSNVIASQAVHEAFGGAVAELASRAHQQNIIPVVSEALKRAGIDKSELSAFGVYSRTGIDGVFTRRYVFCQRFCNRFGHSSDRCKSFAGTCHGAFYQGERR